jgi:hypothetical protein
MAGSVQWRGAVEMGNNCTIYGNKVIEAVRQVAEYFAPVFETYAKQNAPWTDRTGNARQSLHAWTEQLSKDAVALYLSHGVFYGQFLEYKYSGRYAIIWPTIQAHLDAIMRMLRGIFG